MGDRFSSAIRRPGAWIIGEYRENLYIGFSDGVSRFVGGKAPVPLPPFGFPGAMIVASNELWLAGRDRHHSHQAMGTGSRDAG